MPFSKKLVEDTQLLWEERLGRQVSESEAQNLLSDLTGFFSLLWEWNQEYESETNHRKDKNENFS